MDFENFMGFLPLLIFVITVVIDKSNRKKRRNRTGHFSAAAGYGQQPG